MTSFTFLSSVIHDNILLVSDPRPPLNIFAKMIGDTSATVTVTLPDQWKSYYDVVILTTYVMDLHTNTGRGIDTQRAGESCGTVGFINPMHCAMIYPMIYYATIPIIANITVVSCYGSSLFYQWE